MKHFSTKKYVWTRRFRAKCRGYWCRLFFTITGCGYSDAEIINCVIPYI